MTADSPDLDRLDALAVEAIRDGNPLAPTIRALITELRQARDERDAALVKVAAVQRIVDHPPFCGEVHVDTIRDALTGTTPPGESDADQPPIRHRGVPGGLRGIAGNEGR